MSLETERQKKMRRQPKAPAAGGFVVAGVVDFQKRRRTSHAPQQPIVEEDLVQLGQTLC